MKTYKHPIYGVIPKPSVQKTSKVGRLKPMTEWQKKKLGWYLDEGAWHRDIKSRVAVGDKVVVQDDHGNIKEVRDNALPK